MAHSFYHNSDFLNKIEKKYQKVSRSAKHLEIKTTSPLKISKSQCKTELEIAKIDNYSKLNSPKYPLFPSRLFFNQEKVSEEIKNKSMHLEKIDLNENQINNNNNYSDNIFPISMMSPTIRLSKLKSKLKGPTQFVFGIENGKLTKVLMERWRLTELIISLFCLISIGFSILEFDVEFQENSENFITQNTLCWISFILTIILIFLTIARLKWKKLLKKERKQFIKKESFFSIIKWLRTCIQIIIILPHPNPFTQDIIIHFYSANRVLSYYKLNEIFNFFLLLRIHLVCRFFLIQSFYFSNRAQRTCNFYAVRPSYWFTAKCMLKSHPYLIMGVFLFGSIFLFAQAIRIAECALLREISDDQIFDKVYSGLDYRDYQNAIWLMWITVTTVGYGDITPKTPLGRLVIIAISFVGLINISLIVATFQNELNMNSLEKSVYNTLDRLRARDIIKEKAKKVLKSMIAFNKIARNANSIDKNAFYNVKNSLDKFRNSKTVYKSLADENYNVADDLAKYFVEMELKLNNISVGQIYLKEEIAKIKKNECEQKKKIKFLKLEVENVSSNNELQLINELEEIPENISEKKINILVSKNKETQTFSKKNSKNDENENIL